MTFKKINRLQNQQGQLRMLLAQRRLHSGAKNWVGAQLCILVLLPMFASICSLAPGCPLGLTTLIAVVALSLDVLLVDPRVKENKNKAVNIQEQFDCKVLGLAWPAWKLKSKEEPARHSHELGPEFEEQVKNQRLANWYHEPKSARSAQQIILGCQKQNLIYSEELRNEIFKKMLWGLAGLGLAELLVLYALKQPLGNFLVKYLAAVTPLVTWLIRELFRIREYQKRSTHLLGFVNDLFGKKVSAEILRHIQDEVLELRKIAPVVYDFHYWRRRNSLEEMISI